MIFHAMLWDIVGQFLLLLVGALIVPALLRLFDCYLDRKFPFKIRKNRRRCSRTLVR